MPRAATPFILFTLISKFNNIHTCPILFMKYTATSYGPQVVQYTHDRDDAGQSFRQYICPPQNHPLGSPPKLSLH
ncbi:uncharacterized protein BO87DRAFT_45312 [Aspergillus neoniger CBS 115656]|uniref:Uncharacterized protein n=1 Tax=Aspergillus neoniger (strain CBS 115656) TaxID=1448310 RepID=A0A318YS81_ASPNB|nr:hypothetical protein BO87DRAFT_45312 [Aspergillus neoniger CBS 115656]PYH34910.1 hypothetical protein BO87DRAFT_45312 [Aspergillus neoniger CBS 115656]